MPEFMHYKKAAPLLGLTETALYNGIRAGLYPACRIGGPRGRWYVDLNAIRQRIDQLMNQNVRDDKEEDTDNFLRPKLRRIAP